MSEILLYDEACGFCRSALRLVLRWDRGGRLRAVGIRSDEGQALLAGLDEAARLDSWHFIDACGHVTSAGAAAATLARALPGGRPLAALFDHFPGTTEKAYRLVAANRSRLAALLRLRQ